MERLFLLLMLFSATEACMYCNGEEYRGTISTTKNGRTCQRWDSQTPHQHEFVPSLSPGMNLEENYCRNPDSISGPWCYTTDPLVRWEYCSIPRCITAAPTIVPEFTCASGDGNLYRGNVSVTTTGKTCQSWSSQTPHLHDRTPENFQCEGLDDNNFCRNPDQMDGPWCYTTSPGSRWEYCNIPICVESESKKQILRIEVKSNLNVHDSSVLESVLQWVKQKLKDQGIEKDTMLAWRLQPGENVFSPKPQERNLNETDCPYT